MPSLPGRSTDCSLSSRRERLYGRGRSRARATPRELWSAQAPRVTSSFIGGEDDQPVNTFLGDAARTPNIGVSSRWPHLCYILWNSKRLGGIPTWPIINYIIEKRPSALGLLATSNPWTLPGQTLSGDQYAIELALTVADADQDVGNLGLYGDLSETLVPGSTVNIVGAGIPDGDYEILRIELDEIISPTVITAGGVPIPGMYWQVQNIGNYYITISRVFLVGGTLGATGAGTIEPYLNDTNDGANIAHIIAEMLFAPFPQGLGLDPDHVIEGWDLDSLDALGNDADDQGWRNSVAAADGETAEAVLANCLQDVSTLLPMSSSLAKLQFVPIREPSGTLPHLSESILTDALPEIVQTHDGLKADRVLFSFLDRDNFFAERTIQIVDNGQAAFAEHNSARIVPLTSAVHFTTAAKLAELRSPEELSPNAEITLEASREARELIPGDAVTVHGFDEVMRVIEVEIEPLEETVKLKVFPDTFGVPLSTFLANVGGSGQITQPPVPDLAYIPVEIPERLTQGLQQAIIVPRIRATDAIALANIHLSRDGSTYTLVAAPDFIATGGYLTSVLSATGPTIVGQGPTFYELGPDVATLTDDLSANPTAWAAGQQVCIIVSGDNVEICFLQRATIVSATERRLDGLLRGRFDTRKVFHDLFSAVFIFQAGSVDIIQDPLLGVDLTLYSKSQPVSTGGEVLLSAVQASTIELYGKGLRPIAPGKPYLRAPFMGAPAFETGDDLEIAWNLNTGSISTGAGYIEAGTAIATPDIPGNVVIELLTSGDVLAASYTQQANDLTHLTVTNAALVAAFGSEPTSFKVVAYHISNGYLSAPSETLIVERV
jgi:hypothetical protein